MPSSIASSIFRKSTTSSKRSERSSSKLSSEHLDLLEHAALLYHGFEWQEAVDAFQYLAKAVETSESRIICALNAGMIQARLGDYADAARTIEAAARHDQSFVLTPYLLGIMEWELGNVIKAEACLEVCLEALHGGDVSYAAHDLDFVLRAEDVRRQLRMIQDSIRLSGDREPKIPSIAILSAESIFEAPPRSAKARSSRTSQQQEAKAQDRLSKRSIHLDNTDSQQSTSSAVTVKAPAKTSLRQESRLSTATHGSYDSTTQVEQQPPEPLPCSTYYTSWRRRPSTPYIPRDAKGEYGSVRELARFIRRYQHQPVPLEPREARVEPESTTELARFIKHSGRERSGVILPEYVRGEPVLRSSTYDCYAESVNGLQLHRAHSLTDVKVISGAEKTALLKRYSDPGSPHLPHSQHVSRGGSSPSSPYTLVAVRRLSAPASVWDDDDDDDDRLSDETLELLLPKVYDPNQKAQPEPHKLSKKSLALLDGEGDRSWNPLGNVHTAGSETSSLFRQSMVTVERADVARDVALRVLEGRKRAEKAVRSNTNSGILSPKPLPPTPNVNRFENIVSNQEAGEAVRVPSSKIFGYLNRT